LGLTGSLPERGQKKSSNRLFDNSGGECLNIRRMEY